MRKGEDGSPDDSLLMRVQSNLRRRNIVVADYSGWECPQWVLQAMPAAFKSELELETSMLENSFTFARACDFGPTQNRVLTAISHQHHGSTLCVHCNMIDRLPRKARQYIKGALPRKDASVEARRAAHLEIGRWQLDNRKWVFPI